MARGALGRVTEGEDRATGTAGEGEVAGMSKPGSDRWSRETDRIVQRTAKKISAAFDEMVASLPEDAAPQMALELVVSELVPRSISGRSEPSVEWPRR